MLWCILESPLANPMLSLPRLNDVRILHLEPATLGGRRCACSFGVRYRAIIWPHPCIIAWPLTTSHGCRFSKDGEDAITLVDLSNEYRVGVGCVSSVVSHKGELALMNLSGSRISRCRLDGLNEVVFIPG